MSAGCPLCGGSVKQLDLAGVKFIGHHNKTAAILRLLRDVPAGLTWEEISRVTKFSHATVSARLHDLKGRNEITTNGKRRTNSGRLATVFCVVPKKDDADTAQLVAPCLCDPNPFQCGDECPCVGCHGKRSEAAA